MKLSRHKTDNKRQKGRSSVTEILTHPGRENKGKHDTKNSKSNEKPGTCSTYCAGKEKIVRVRVERKLGGYERAVTVKGAPKEREPVIDAHLVEITMNPYPGGEGAYGKEREETGCHTQ